MKELLICLIFVFAFSPLYSQETSGDEGTITDDSTAAGIIEESAPTETESETADDSSTASDASEEDAAFTKLAAGSSELIFGANLHFFVNGLSGDNPAVSPSTFLPSIQPEFHYFLSDSLYTGVGLNITWMDYGIFDGIAAQVPIEYADALTLLKIKLYIPLGFYMPLDNSFSIAADFGPVINLHIPLVTHGTSTVADDVLGYWYNPTRLFSIRASIALKRQVYENIGFFVQLSSDMPILNGINGDPILHHFYAGGAVGIMIYL